jgi:hypothetical protein
MKAKSRPGNDRKLSNREADAGVGSVVDSGRSLGTVISLKLQTASGRINVPGSNISRSVKADAMSYERLEHTLTRAYV